MAQGKNWVKDAAAEIAHAIVEEVVNVSNRFAPVSEAAWMYWVEGRIVEHTPFKEGVACMPVPRCEMCKHWSSFEHEHTWGDCLHDEHNEGVHLIVEDIISTHKDFGCVQWEAK